ncbi:hypothetical protein ACWC5F_30550, partial [Streptomyces sp. NPDC001272]
VAAVDLEVAAHETVCVLGPSGTPVGRPERRRRVGPQRGPGLEPVEAGSVVGVVPGCGRISGSA